MVLIEQIEALLDYLEDNQEMAFGNISKTKEGRYLSMEYWTECAEILNSVIPNCPTKSPEEWRTYFNEFKYKTLKKVKSRQSGRSGVAKKVVLTPTQRRLYKILAREVEDSQSEIQVNSITAWRDLRNNDKKKAAQNRNEIRGYDPGSGLGHTTPNKLTPVEEQRTEAQLKKCWDNIKNRRMPVHARAARSRSADERAAPDEDSDSLPSDPLMPVKQEQPAWTHVQDDDSNSASKEFEVAEVSLGAVTSPPREARLPDDESFATTIQRPKVSDRCQERIEELHKLKVAEQVWTLKTLRERHATAQLERERALLERQRAQEESERAKLDREKARLERDAAEYQREKALLELDRAKRADTAII